MHRTRGVRVLALAAGCVGIAAFPAAASAKITIASDPDHPVAGDTIDINGKVTGRGHAHHGVKLFAKAAGTGRFVQIARQRTTGGGAYAFDVQNVSTNTTYQVRATRKGKSAKLLVPVALDINWSAAPADGSNQAIGSPIPFTLVVTNKSGQGVAGVPVSLENRDRRKSEQADQIGTGTTDSTGKVTIPVTFPGEPRSANVIAETGATRTNASGRTVLSSSFQLQEPQNSSFLLAATPNPTTASQLVTLGVLKSGGGGQGITFLGHNEGTGAGFDPFANATTAGDGSASVQHGFGENTTVVATSGGATSARVAIGVRDVLTGSVSSTNVVAGQSVTLSGHVVPAHPGQNAVISEQTGTKGTIPILHKRKEVPVGEDGNFATSIELAHAGTRTFFVSLNGGAENQGTVAAVPPITVTPAP